MYRAFRHARSGRGPRHRPDGGSGRGRRYRRHPVGAGAARGTARVSARCAALCGRPAAGPGEPCARASPQDRRSGPSRCGAVRRPRRTPASIHAVIEALMIERALLSVADKTGIVVLARGLVEAGCEIISTGGTAGALREAGIPVTALERVTGFPEILGGRVKTLHPAVHGALLAVRANE